MGATALGPPGPLPPAPGGGAGQHSGRRGDARGPSPARPAHPLGAPGGPSLRRIPDAALLMFHQNHARYKRSPSPRSRVQGEAVRERGGLVRVGDVKGRPGCSEGHGGQRWPGSGAAAVSAVPVCRARCNRPCEPSGSHSHSLFWAPAQAQVLRCCVPALEELRTDPSFYSNL